MTYPETSLDRLGVELNADAERYAQRTKGLAGDPYFREALVKISVSNFVWALYHAFDGDSHALEALSNELKVQSSAIGRAVHSEQPGS